MGWGHLAFCAAICLEAAVCFAVPVFLLFFGMLYLPLLVFGLASGEPLFLVMVGLTLLGAAGMAGVIRILFLLCARRQRDPRSTLTLSALACGAAAALLFALTLKTGPTPTRPGVVTEAVVTIIALPLACMLHLIYLARRALFT